MSKEIHRKSKPQATLSGFWTFINFLHRLLNKFSNTHKKTPHIHSFLPNIHNFLPDTHNFLPNTHNFLPNTTEFLFDTNYFLFTLDNLPPHTHKSPKNPATTTELL